MLNFDKNTSNVIRYTTKGYEEWRNLLIEFAKRYYPDTIDDFTGASANAMFVQMLAIIGDALDFYQDFQTNESFFETQLQFENVLKVALDKGYKPQFGYVAHGQVMLYVAIPASQTILGPDMRYAPILKKGSVFASFDNNNFLLVEDLDFSINSEVRVGSVSASGTPTFYILKKSGKVSSGELKIIDITIPDYEEFATFSLPDSNVSELISVIDSEGHEYYEVNNLAQNTIYQEIEYDTVGATTVLKPITVARRFVARYYPSYVSLQFGGGSDNLEIDYVNSPQDTLLEFSGRSYISNLSFDPAQLIKNDKFGVAPSNTVLTIIYRSNSAENVNFGVGQLINVVDPILKFQNAVTLEEAATASVVQSLMVANEEPITGSLVIANALELKARVREQETTQARAVTKSDFRAVIYNMPARFGGIYRCNVFSIVNRNLKTDLNLYVVGQNADETLVLVNSIVKENIKNYLSLYKMLSDSCNILDVKIVNLGLDYEILLERNFDRNRAILAANTALIDQYRVLGEVGEPFSITNAYNALKRVTGVVDVTKIHIYQKRGGAYSTVAFDVGQNKTANGLYITCPENVIFEIKYPIQDIQGTAR